MLQKNAQSVHNNIIIKVMMTETDNGRILELHRLRQDVAKKKQLSSATFICALTQFASCKQYVSYDAETQSGDSGKLRIYM